MRRRKFTEHRRRAVMFYCHHSTGLGHLVRSLAVAGALAKEARVTICCGGQVPEGLPVPPGVEVLALPPISANSEGRLAVWGASASVGETLRVRAQLLADCFDQLEPEVLVIELFPFGRRKFAAELLPLLERARSAQPVPLVVCSVRDLLVSGHPDKSLHDEEAARRLDAYFDAVVVHGDPRFARLEETFHPVVPAEVPVFYSGFVAAGPFPQPAACRRRDVVVSAGGGLVGADLFRTAAATHVEYLRQLGYRTRIVTGPFLPESDLVPLMRRAEAEAGLTVERFVPNLRDVLAGSAVSVSQCGYNTSLDILLAQVPSVVVPYGDDTENEQPERARRLAALGAVDVIASDELNARSLAETVLGLAEHPRRCPPFDLDGAQQTARIVSSLLNPPVAVAR